MGLQLALVTPSLKFSVIYANEANNRNTTKISSILTFLILNHLAKSSTEWRSDLPKVLCVFILF